MSKEKKSCCDKEIKDSKENCKCHKDSDTKKCNCDCHKEDETCKCGCHTEGDTCKCGCDCGCGESGNSCECGCGENGCCNGNCKCGELKSQIELLEKQVEENKKLASQYLSTASYYKTQAEDNKKDFERFKERNKNIEIEAKTKANETVAKKLLPIIDNFDQAIAHITDAEIIKGFSMIYSSLVSTLTDIGVEEIKTAKGDDLNPEYHNCISTEETDDSSLDGKISAVYQKGYMFAESKKVIRPATVSVYKA